MVVVFRFVPLESSQTAGGLGRQRRGEMAAWRSSPA